VAIPVRITIKKDDFRSTKFGDTASLPEFEDLPIEVAHKFEVGSDGKHDIPEGYIHINGVDMRCYPRTDVWTDVGDGYEAQLKVGYESKTASWFSQSDREALRKLRETSSKEPGLLKRIFGKKAPQEPNHCGNCKLFDRHTGVKEMSAEMGSYCNQDHPDLWVQDTVDWIAEQVQAPTVDMGHAGYCYAREMIVQDDFPPCKKWE